MAYHAAFRACANRTAAAVLGTLTFFILGTSAHAISLASPYSADYTFAEYSGPAGVPASYGGVTFKAGDPNTLLIGGAANGSAGAIYQAPVTRDGSGHIVGFGSGTLYATAPNIDGGLAYGPGGVLFYTGYPTNQIGQIKPGSSSPDKITSAPIVSSVGTLNFIPAGFPNAGDMVLASYSGGVVGRVQLTSDGSGTYNFGALQNAVTTGRGPEGLIYIAAGNPDFALASMLISEYSTGTVSTYQLDANGMPIPGTRQDFLTGLSGAEGAVIDPLTGDFLFSTFGGGNQVVVVRGFNAPPSVPVPAALPLFASGLAGLAVLARRRKKRAAA